MRFKLCAICPFDEEEWITDFLQRLHDIVGAACHAFLDTVVNDFLHFLIVKVSASHQQADAAVEFLCLWPKMVGHMLPHSLVICNRAVRHVAIVIVVGVEFSVSTAVIV